MEVTDTVVKPPEKKQEIIESLLKKVNTINNGPDPNNLEQKIKLQISLIMRDYDLQLEGKDNQIE